MIYILPRFYLTWLDSTTLYYTLQLLYYTLLDSTWLNLTLLDSSWLDLTLLDSTIALLDLTWLSCFQESAPKGPFSNSPGAKKKSAFTWSPTASKRVCTLIPCLIPRPGNKASSLRMRLYLTLLMLCLASFPGHSGSSFWWLAVWKNGEGRPGRFSHVEWRQVEDGRYCLIVVTHKSNK